MRLYVAIVILLLAGAALLASLSSKPAEPMLLVDAQASPAEPQMLFSPCPLSPRNLPPAKAKRIDDA